MALNRFQNCLRSVRDNLSKLNGYIECTRSYQKDGYVTLLNLIIRLGFTQICGIFGLIFTLMPMISAVIMLFGHMMNTMLRVQRRRGKRATIVALIKILTVIVMIRFSIKRMLLPTVELMFRAMDICLNIVGFRRII